MSASRSVFRDIGAPVRLPLRVAVEVAWRSIRVRFVRSLVTVSSVVLAVAFLLAVRGQDVAVRAVHGAYAAATVPERQAGALHAALERQRDARALLALIAAEAAPASAASASAAAQALRLIGWLDRLTPAQGFLMTRTADAVGAVLDLDRTGVAAFAATAASLKSERSALDRAALDALAGQLPALRDAVAARQASERERVALVAAQGGPDAVLLRCADLLVLPDASALAASCAALGVPLFDLVPALDAVARADLARELRHRHAVVAAAATLAAISRQDLSLLRAEDVRDWPLLAQQLTQQPSSASAAGPVPAASAIAARMLRLAKELKDLRGAPDASLPATAPGSAPALVAVLNRVLANPRFYDKAAFAGLALPSEALRLIQSNPAKLAERRLTRLNRLLLESAFPGCFASRMPGGPWDLGHLSSGDLLADPAAGEAIAALKTIVGDLDAFTAALRERAQQNTVAMALSRVGYDPQASGERTFWLLVLSLLVCVVGIVNTMTMAVTERFREIATMKCLGALDTFILKAFLIESAAIGAVGALAGALLGGGLILIQASWRFGSAFWQAFPAGDLVAAAGLAAACGVGLAVFGALLPAFQAARMQPVDALRVDL